MNRRIVLTATIVGMSAILGGGLFLASSSADTRQSSGVKNSRVFVGGDLHTLTVVGNQLFVTGHEGAGVSINGGRSWHTIASLNYADIMGWSTTPKGFLAGGHPGLYRSSDNGSTFTKINFYKNVSDVHSIGSAGSTVYLGSPQIGLLVSLDGGKTWKLRNAKVGQGFMGSMLVDPSDPKRVIAPDMQAGLVISSNGGVTWKSMGGPPGTMSVAWNPKNIRNVASIGMMSSATSSDGGRTWKSFSPPKNATAIAYSANGKTLYVASLIGDQAQAYSSSNSGKTWIAATSATTVTTKTSAMDPNMPGMNHIEIASPKRPVALTLGTFGVATSSVFVSAIILRRKDRIQEATKKMTRSGSIK